MATSVAVYNYASQRSMAQRDCAANAKLNYLRDGPFHSQILSFSFPSDVDVRQVGPH